MVLMEIAKAILRKDIEKISKTGPVITVDLKGGSKITVGKTPSVLKTFKDKPHSQLNKR